MRVAVVGYGHYARDLIIPAYLRHGVTVAGIIGRKSDPNEIDPGTVYDVCVRPDDIYSAVMWLVMCSATKIILPKPIARTQRELNNIIDIHLKYGVTFAVASQWAYDTGLIDALARVKQAEFIFRDKMFNRGYAMYDAFAPHVLHLCHAAGIKPVAEYREMGDSTKERTLIMNGKRIDLTKRGDLFKPMIDDFTAYFDIGNESINSLENYLPIAESFIAGRP